MTAPLYNELWEIRKQYCCDWIRKIMIFPGAWHIADLNSLAYISEEELGTGYHLCVCHRSYEMV